MYMSHLLAIHVSSYALYSVVFRISSQTGKWIAEGSILANCANM